VDVYDDDWSRLAWVELRGEVRVLAAAECKGALEALVAKYEQYRAEPPPGPVLELRPAAASCWRHDEH
jgi:hypothetical protein